MFGHFTALCMKGLTTERKAHYCIISFYLEDIPTFNDSVIKNTHVKN